MPDIEYFYSAHSSYAYLGSSRFMAIARNAGRRIVHKPVDLDQVLAGAGSKPFAERDDRYREYFFFRELQRWSEERGAPIKGRPTHHLNDPTLVNCMLVAGTLDGLNVDKLAHALLEAHWRYDADLANPSNLEQLASAAGYDALKLLDGARGSTARETYAANTREAIERSVFGSPTYFVDGDMFYGQDRLEMVERALRKPYPRRWSGA